MPDAECILSGMTGLIAGASSEIGAAPASAFLAKSAPVSRGGGGNGFDNMRERLRNIGGRFECHSRPGHGTRIVFSLPGQAAAGG